MLARRYAGREPLPLAGVEGLEPPTPGFGDRCSSQLSYTPKPRALYSGRFSPRHLPVSATVAAMGQCLPGIARAPSSTDLPAPFRVLNARLSEQGGIP